jgi:hypothetical protein
MIMPTVGRIVWFWPDKNDCPGQWPGEQPLAAIITHVVHNRRVHLNVFEATGGSCAKVGVLLKQPSDPDVYGEHCSWMPYQVGQAQKHESADLSAANGDAKVSMQQPSLADKLGSITDEGHQAGQGQAIQG